MPSHGQTLETLTLLVKTVQHDQAGLIEGVIAVIESVLRHSSGLSPGDREGLAAARDDLHGLVDETVGLLSDLEAAVGEWDALGWGPVAMDELVSSAIEEFAGRNGHTVVADLAPVVAIANGELVSRGVRNLIGNVFRHTPTDTTVYVTLTTDDGTAEVVVADDGPGIPDALKGIVFDPFTRGAGSENRSGIGLGLSLVRDVAIHHGGQAEVRDRPGRGSVFVLRIPVAGAPILGRPRTSSDPEAPLPG